MFVYKVHLKSNTSKTIYLNPNNKLHGFLFKVISLKSSVAQSAGDVEYTDCFSAEG